MIDNNNFVVVVLLCSAVVWCVFDCNITSTHHDFSALVSLSIASASRTKSQPGTASIFKLEAKLETTHCYAVRG